MLVSFTHDVEIDRMLPGVSPTCKYVEVPTVAIVNFRGDKLCHERIYWDQASVLVQIGLLDPAGLPVAGSETAKKLVDETRPSNTLYATLGGECWNPVRSCALATRRTRRRRAAEEEFTKWR
jgi:carboxymethylenebutenolidase